MILVLINIVIAVAMIAVSASCIFWGGQGVIASLGNSTTEVGDNEDAFIFGIVAVFGLLLGVGTIASVF